MAKRNYFAIAGFVFVVLLLITLIALASVVLVKVTDNNKNDDDANKAPTVPDSCPANPLVWQDMACCRDACPKGWGKRPVLLVSMDGFRADYLLRNKTPSIQRMIDCGSHPPFMFPSYESVTFPNHYSIVTGLYPESHGIISNTMFDSNITNKSNQYFDISDPSSHDPQWWLGEPFWNTVVKNDLVAGTYFWPGSDVTIQNMTPTYWYTYDGSVPFYQRVDTVIEWLLYPETKRPQFITLYFSEPDETGHDYGPYAPELNNELIVIDSFINYLMRSLFENDLLNCLDIVLVADHGMELINQTVYFGAENYINTKADGLEIFTGPVGRVQIASSDLTAEGVFEGLVCQNNISRVYYRQEVPRRLHYSISDRIGDVVIDMDDSFVFEKSNASYDFEIGNHGFDYKYNSMHALFVAFGPSFKKNFIATPFQNIELYNLFADNICKDSDLCILDLVNIPEDKRAPNNGTVGTLDQIMLNPPSRDLPFYQTVDHCPYESETLKPCGNCSFLNSQKCQNSFSSILVQPYDVDSTICNINNCDYSMFYSENVSMPIMLQAQIKYDSEMITAEQLGCSTVVTDNDCNDITTRNDALSAVNATMYPLLDFDAATSTAATLWFAKAPMYDGFYSGVWKWVQNLTMSYTVTYHSVVVFSGAIFDFDFNGVADNVDLIMTHTNPTVGAIPTHFYQILLRCDGTFNNDGICQGNPYVLSFILPHIARPRNYCETPVKYLYKNTGRIRDIELLTGLEFFTNWNFTTAVYLRTKINDEFW